MRFKRPYRLIRRTRKDGKKYYRYRIWDPVTKKRREFSTGKTTRDAAERFCEALLEQGQLVPGPSPLPTQSPALTETVSPLVPFEVFAKGWWGSECPYTRAEAERGFNLKPSYRTLCGIRLRRNLLPYFGKVPLCDITPKAIEDWRRQLPDSPRVRNTAVSTLSTMLGEAVRLGYLLQNPCTKVKPIKESDKVRELLTLEESGLLLDDGGPNGIWRKHPLEYHMVLLASKTGLRAGELQGLEVDRLEWTDDICWLRVTKSWDGTELVETKNRRGRLVPVEAGLAREVFHGAPINGFVFSEDGGKTPIRYERIRSHLRLALAAMGIDKETQKRRGLGLHAFRHGLNTNLRGKVPDHMVRAVIGHLSEGMTEHYTDHSHESLADVAQFFLESKTGTSK